MAPAARSSAAVLAPRPWCVLIAERDPGMAEAYRQTVARTPSLRVAGAVRRGEDALAFVRHRGCDLVLLDLGVGGMGGLHFLRQLRGAGHSVEVIALSAVRNAAVVRAVLQCGALDYLLKPFALERLSRALRSFVQRSAALQREFVDQAAIDVAYSGWSRTAHRRPSGVTEGGIARVRGILERASGPVSCVEVASAAGLARVTARRYLEHLVSIEAASVDAHPDGPGRPRKLYRISLASPREHRPVTTREFGLAERATPA